MIEYCDNLSDSEVVCNNKAAYAIAPQVSGADDYFACNDAGHLKRLIDSAVDFYNDEIVVIEKLDFHDAATEGL